MRTGNRSTVVGVFHDRASAKAAMEELRKAGFRDDQLGIVTHGEGTTTAKADGSCLASDPTGTRWEEGTGIGAAAGAATGLGLGIAVAASLIPGVGPVIAGGTFLALLASAGAGAAVGSVLGGLIGLGVPEEEAQYYEGEFKSGRTLLTVKADARWDEAMTIVRRHGGYDRSSAPAMETSARTATTTARGSQKVELKEERLHAEKQPVQTGEVTIRKEVVTERKSLEVPVTREEVVIERHAVGGKHATSGDIRPGEEIRIPVKEERVTVHKDTVVTEEVSVGKRKVQDTEKVSGTVRKEKLKVDEKGDVDVRGDTGKPRR